MQKQNLNQTTTRTVVTLFVISMFALLLSACVTTQPVIDEYTGEITFTSKAQLREYIKAQSSGGMSYGITDMAMPQPAIEASSRANILDSSSAPKYSETNVQVQGIDEADIIKTDGEFLYIISQTQLYVVDAESLAIITNHTLPFYSAQIYIVEDQVIALGTHYGYGRQEVSPHFGRIMPIPSRAQTYVYFFANDGGVLSLAEELLFDGSVLESRLSEQLYLITRSSATDEYIVPFFVDTQMREVAIDRIRPFGPPSTQYTTVFKIGLDADVQETQSVLGNIAIVYMGDHLYLTAIERIQRYEIEREVSREVMSPYLTREDRNLIAEIESVNSFILSDWEKIHKIDEVMFQRISRLDESEMEKLEARAEELLQQKLSQFEFMVYSHIVKVDTNSLEILATQKIGGQVPNQFAMDEYEGVLRVATNNNWWTPSGRDQSANVYTLDSQLRVLDSKHNIAPEESIFATRFRAEKLYMVTFRDIDPFFVIDLSNPSQIVIEGELKIPGFSRYLHPISDTLVIGIGQEVDGGDMTAGMGRITGLKVSLFDVSDVTNPLEVAKYVTQEYAYSAALYDHKAFMYDSSRNTLIIPQDSYSARSESGALVLSVDEDAKTLEYRGLVKHDGVQRVVYIDESLYTLSYYELRKSDFETLHELASVTLYAQPEYVAYPMPRGW